MVLDIVDRCKPQGYGAKVVGDGKPAIMAGMKKLSEKTFNDWFTDANKNSDGIVFSRLNVANKIALNSLTTTIIMSGETAQKQKFKHPDLTAYHYTQLASNINDADVIVLKRDGNKLVFFFIDEKLYEAIIKVTKDKKEIYLVSFYRAEKTKIDREARSGTVLTDKRVQ